MKPEKIKTVDAYVKSFPKEKQTLLQNIRKAIQEVAPQAEEGISYGMPSYKLGGKPLVYFAAFDKHIGFYATPTGHSAFKKELSIYKQGKGSVQFPLKEPIPIALVKKIVKFRVQENTQAMKATDKITISTTVNSDIKTVWKTWTKPEHIKKWNQANDDWHTTKAENDLRAGGKFSSRMEAKDGSMGFNFGGTYDEVVPNEHISYTLDDGRMVTIDFRETENGIAVTETFEPESQNPTDLQRQGWQAILDNFKEYAESMQEVF
ncbi:MAG: SRPBCC domain-containing protein [Maribacter sp.]|uniref:SRPBCC domain-containing protein n=1 Tax=Maribacter sp. TaxID=1897614 RepID=UPI003C73F152